MFKDNTVLSRESFLSVKDISFIFYLSYNMINIDDNNNLYSDMYTNERFALACGRSLLDVG